MTFANLAVRDEVIEVYTKKTEKNEGIMVVKKITNDYFVHPSLQVFTIA